MKCNTTVSKPNFAVPSVGTKTVDMDLLFRRSATLKP